MFLTIIVFEASHFKLCYVHLPKISEFGSLKKTLFNTDIVMSNQNFLVINVSKQDFPCANFCPG